MCTTFALKNGNNVVLGQGYDFYYGHGMVVVNKRGIHKVALCDDLTEENLYDDGLKTPRWISRYGSISFNQFGREIPTCGVNEAGLAVASMWHDTEKALPSSTETSISELQWIQYQLDCFSNVEELIESVGVPAMRTEIYPMHYLVSDRTGNSAVIEIENGNIRAFDSAEHFACSNEGFMKSIEYAERYKDIKPDHINIKEPILDRAAKALVMTKKFNDAIDPGDPVEYSFRILDAVRLSVDFKALFKWVGKGVPPSQTFWQIVFDLGAMRIYFKTKANGNTRVIDVMSFDFSTETDVQILDMEGDGEGDVRSMFRGYSRSANERIVKASFRPMKEFISESDQEGIIVYPELFVMERNTNECIPDTGPVSQ